VSQRVSRLQAAHAQLSQPLSTPISQPLAIRPPVEIKVEETSPNLFDRVVEKFKMLPEAFE